jgi:3-hydroxybutyryl-CoA dehydrogenase
VAVEIVKIAVIGSGIMGHGIALVCACGGFHVTLVDVKEEALHAASMKLRASMMQLVEAGLAPLDGIETVLGNIAYATNMSEGVREAGLIFEAVPEQPALKQSVYAQLEACAEAEAIFASNTSGIPVNALASMTKRPGRFLGTHFFMPAHLIPLVEVVRGNDTSEEVVSSVMDLLVKLGKKPVQVRKDIPGFIANRLQHALAREAMSLVGNGVVSIEDLDTVVRNSIAVRLLFTGPMEQRDFNGLDTHLSIAEYLYKGLEASREPLDILKNKVADGNFGIKTGQGFYDWRGKDLVAVNKDKNERLIAVLKLLQRYE